LECRWRIKETAPPAGRNIIGQGVIGVKGEDVG
jgi:hypothetical protein